MIGANGRARRAPLSLRWTGLRVGRAAGIAGRHRARTQLRDHGSDHSGPSGRTETILSMASHTRSRRTSHRTAQRTASEVERSLLDAIAEGELDGHLGAIAAAVDARRRLLHTIDSSHVLATLCVGDRVRIGPRVSPRYLAGLDGTIVEVDDHAATVRLDSPVGRFESGCVRCPPLVLEKPSR